MQTPEAVLCLQLLIGFLWLLPVVCWTVTSFWAREHLKYLYKRGALQDYTGGVPNNSKPAPVQYSDASWKGLVSPQRTGRCSTGSGRYSTGSLVHLPSTASVKSEFDAEEILLEASLPGGSHRTHVAVPMPLNVLIWFVFLFVVYGVSSQIAMLQTNNTKLARPESSVAQRFADIECILFRGMTLLMFGVQNRLKRRQMRFFLGLVLYNSVIYATAYGLWVEVHGKSLELSLQGARSNADLQEYSRTVRLLISVTSTFLFTIMFHHIMVALHQKWALLKFYISTLCMVISFTTIGLAAYRFSHMKPHYYWGAWLLAHFMCFGTKASLAAQAALIALFLHGVSHSGCPEVFEYSCTA